MSPHASTALPEVAITLNRATRSIPAMPMALNNPPIVVGIKATSRATRLTTAVGCPTNAATGGKVATAIRNTCVSTANNTVKAISLGVLVRSAPSTNAIIRSMNPWPGSAVMRISRLSDNNRVPPVTEEATSEPASFKTGADSPVIADSSTDPTPANTSPSAGINSPAFTRTRSPRRNSAESTKRSVPLASSRQAWVRACVRRKASA